MQRTTTNWVNSKMFIVLCFSLLLHMALIAQEQREKKGANPLTTKDGVLNDGKIKDYVINKCSELYEDGQAVSIMDLFKNVGGSFDLQKVKASKNESFDYEKQKEGVLIMAKLYLCDKCPNFHANTSSGFVISKDGLCVSNHHIFAQTEDDKNTYLGMFAVDCKGNVFPVTKIHAIDEKKDLAIFKVDTRKPLKPLEISSSDASISHDVHLISHPFTEYYSYSYGKVTRYYISPVKESLRASITADFALGSSGAPVMDNNGRVVGVVSSTFALNAAENEAQMVVKQIVPVSEIYELVKNSQL